MTASDVLPPDPPERGRTAWETEHLDDPADDAERHDVAPSRAADITLPGFDIPPADWRKMAEDYRRERDYLRDRLAAAEDEIGDLRDRYYGHRAE